jgi:Mn2+/Fe2+ NRAMP family transporter
VPPAGKNPIACHFGPEIVLAGTSIGSGEWLFGPAVTAQYGAALLWLALLSILFQGFVDRLGLAVLLIFWT